MLNKPKIQELLITGVIVAAIVLLSQFAVGKWHEQPAASFGAVGGLLIENYDPYVMSNGGINTALPFQSSGGVTNSGTLTQSGTATFSSTFTVTGTSTVEKLTTGGFVVSSSTTATAGTLSLSDILAGSYLFTPNTGATTLTLPASSTLATLIPNAGDQTTWYFRNSTTTTNQKANVTFAGGVGTILETASTTNGIANTVVGGGKGGSISFWRSSTSTDIYATLNPNQ